MMKLYHFLRLIRTMNLIVIAITMLVFIGLFSNAGFSEHEGSEKFYFFLLLISTLLIAASGNIINDYFDVKADRVNKPERLIIDRYIKRRWAIVLNWTFNSIGFFISIFLSIKLNNWYLVAISFFTINLLFFYSLYFKRKLLSGNIIVAFLTALVPFQMFVFSFSFNYANCAGFWTPLEYLSIYKFQLLFYCSFAFFLNLTREIMKDLADVKGDIQLNSSTIPIKFGLRKTKIILLVLLIGLVIGMSGAVIYLHTESIHLIHVSENSILIVSSLLSCSLISIIVSAITMLRYNRRKNYLIGSNLLKLAMLFGLLTALFI